MLPSGSYSVASSDVALSVFCCYDNKGHSIVSCVGAILVHCLSSIVEMLPMKSHLYTDAIKGRACSNTYIGCAEAVKKIFLQQFARAE